MRQRPSGPVGRPPRATVVLDLHCSSEEEASAVWAALAVDDPGSIKGTVVGAHLRITVGPATLPSLRASCDDVLACFQAARGAAASTAPPPSTGEGDPDGDDDAEDGEDGGDVGDERSAGTGRCAGRGGA